MSDSPRIAGLTLRCHDCDTQRRFYVEALGMAELDSTRLQYDEQQAWLSFETSARGGTWAPRPNDLYWKIALAVPDVALACRQLAAKGIEVSAPRQFRDVGTLAHLSDPEGFSIELIEHWQANERPLAQPDASAATNDLGGGASFNLITLRAGQIEPVHALCTETLGMRVLSVQPLPEVGFDLHFYAFTQDVPPDAELTGVANRSWTYRRPYTVLEVQHVHGLDRVVRPESGELGYGGIELAGVQPHPQLDLLGMRPA